jgi:hyperosmotically inducible protein
VAEITFSNPRKEDARTFALQGGTGMKSIAVLLLSIALVIGCSKNRSEDKQVSQNATEPDNSGRNVRDRNDQTKTSGDQSENEADRTITQNIRQAVTADDSLSTNAKNVKIVTNDGVVTLRGPVKSEKEKAQIESKAKQIAGVKRVDNQLEITS